MEWKDEEAPARRVGSQRRFLRTGRVLTVRGAAACMVWPSWRGGRANLAMLISPGLPDLSSPCPHAEAIGDGGGGLEIGSLVRVTHHSIKAVSPAAAGIVRRRPPSPSAASGAGGSQPEREGRSHDASGGWVGLRPMSESS